MGWFYMKSFGGHAGPAQYLDAQFTYQSEALRSRVLRSALVGNRVYYAAVEHLRSNTAREVFAVICLVEATPSAHDGYIFGYKDMTEQMGPFESDCPEDILDLLTPTMSEYAVAWRSRCRANATAKRTPNANSGRPCC